MVLSSYKPLMSFETKIKLCLYKSYFETGFGLLNYLKYPLILIGILNKIQASTAIWWSLAYAVVCFAIGYYWFNTDFQKASTEVSNRYNLAMIELRESLNGKRKV